MYSSPKAKGYATQEGDFAIGEWIHVALVANEDEIIGYINGVETNRLSDQTIDLTVGNDKDLYLGKFRDAWYPLGGSLDDFRIYNRVLSASEIQALYSESAVPNQ